MAQEYENGAAVVKRVFNITMLMSVGFVTAVAIFLFILPSLG